MLPTIRRSAIFFILTVVTVSFLLIWNGIIRYQEFKDFQAKQAYQSAESAAKEIEIQIRELKNRVALFVDEEAELIASVAAAPDNDVLYYSLERKVERHFSNHIAFTITNAEGEEYVQNIEGLVGDLCKTDIKSFSKSPHPYDISIHPQPGHYHFDIMVHWSNGEGTLKGIFFISIKPDILSRVLAATEIKDHQLFLLKDDLHGAVELSRDGSRDTVESMSVLPEFAKEHVTIKRKITGARWLLVDVANPELFDDKIDAIARETGLVIVLLIIITFLMFRFLRRSEDNRYVAEAELRRTQHELRLRVKDRDNQLSAARSELRGEEIERLQIQEDLKFRAAVLRCILSQGVRGIIAVNQKGRIITANDKAAEMFGYRKEADLVGLNISEIIIAEEDGLFKTRHEDLQAHAVHSSNTESHATGRREDGSRFPVQILISEARAGHRHVYTAFIRDEAAQNTNETM